MREKRLRETSPIGKNLHAILEFMAHTRDWWKAIVREEELPAPLPLNRDGSYKTAPMEASSEGGADGTALVDGTEGASKEKGSKGHKAKKKEKKRARAETASPVGGAAKKFASNATKPPTKAPKKQKQKRRSPPLTRRPPPPARP